VFSDDCYGSAIVAQLETYANESQKNQQGCKENKNKTKFRGQQIRVAIVH
jgi:hypothetical protein